MGECDLIEILMKLVRMLFIFMLYENIQHLPSQ